MTREIDKRLDREHEANCDAIVEMLLMLSPELLAALAEGWTAPPISDGVQALPERQNLAVGQSKAV